MKKREEPRLKPAEIKHLRRLLAPVNRDDEGESALGAAVRAFPEIAAHASPRSQGR